MTATKRKTFFNRAILGGALMALSAGALAGSVVVKPGSLGVIASEFGSALARSGTYTVVGASQENVVIPGEPIFGGSPVSAQGIVYLFNGTSSTPERVYQFAGNNHFFKRAGIQVAISNKWLAFAAQEGFLNDGNPSKVYIVGKSGGNWTQCPTVSGVIDCSSYVKENGTTGSEPILSIDFPGYVDGPRMTLAISDDYLVIGNSATSEVAIYRYDSSLNEWIQEFSVDDLDERRLGTAVAIEGDKIAISAPESDGYETPAEFGTVRLYKRNSLGTWNPSASVYGYFTDGNFGRTLDMHSGNLLIGSGFSGSDHHLIFYRVDSNGNLSSQEVHLLNAAHKKIALHGDTAIVTTDDVNEIVKVYKRNSSPGSWSQIGALNSYLYISPISGSSYPGSDPVDLVGDDVVLGWRAYQSNIGAFIHEKASLMDKCKSTRNLVANCSFDNAGSGWQFLNHMGASSWASYSGGELKATIYWGSNVHWHIQARTPVDLSEGGTYQLRFRAKADSPRSITANIGHNGNVDNNWTSHGQTSFSVGSTWAEYVYEFYGVPSDNDAFLDFNLGNEGTVSVTIDSISLVASD